MTQSTIQTGAAGIFPQPLKSKPVTEQDIANAPPESYFATRQFGRTTTKNAVINLETQEGDKVTLSYESRATSMSYLRPSGSHVPGLIDGDTFKEKFQIQVDGELNEQELAELDAFTKEVAAIMHNHMGLAAADPTNEPAIAMSRYSSLARYAMQIDAVTHDFMAPEMVLGRDPGYETQTSLPKIPSRSTMPETPFAPAETKKLDHYPTGIETRQPLIDLSMYEKLTRITQEISDKLSQTFSSDKSVGSIDFNKEGELTRLTQDFLDLISRIIEQSANQDGQVSIFV